MPVAGETVVAPVLVVLGNVVGIPGDGGTVVVEPVDGTAVGLDGAIDVPGDGTAYDPLVADVPVVPGNAPAVPGVLKVLELVGEGDTVVVVPVVCAKAAAGASAKLAASRPRFTQVATLASRNSALRLISHLLLHPRCVCGGRDQGASAGGA